MSVVPFGPPAAPAPGGWHPDPHRRFDHRWHDGTSWTATVATRGVQSVDPAGSSAGPPQPAWPQQPAVPQQPQWSQQPAWPQQPTAPVQPGWNAPAQRSSSKAVKTLGVGLLAIIGVLAISAVLAATVASSIDDDPTPAEANRVEQAPALPLTDDVEWTDELADLSARFAWDSATPTERADMCTTWNLSPELARDAFLIGAGAENEELWTAMEDILATEC